MVKRNIFPQQNDIQFNLAWFSIYEEKSFFSELQLDDSFKILYLEKVPFQPVLFQSSVQRFSGFPGRNGVCLVSDWSFGFMVSGKGN